MPHEALGTVSSLVFEALAQDDALRAIYPPHVIAGQEAALPSEAAVSFLLFVVGYIRGNALKWPDK
jgi:hypothetical protein